MKLSKELLAGILLNTAIYTLLSLLLNFPITFSGVLISAAFFVLIRTFMVNR
jgi:hypothetical protein